MNPSRRFRRSPISFILPALGTIAVASFPSVARADSSRTPTQPVAGNLRITAEMLNFKYETFDGQLILPCQAKIEDADSQDWKISCASQPGASKVLQKEFRVHLWVSVYTHPSAPKMSYEVLYWVQDRTVPAKIEGTGATVWFHLNDPSALNTLMMSQSVDHDTAGLYLTLKVPQ